LLKSGNTISPTPSSDDDDCMFENDEWKFCDSPLDSEPGPDDGLHCHDTLLLLVWKFLIDSF
jgi:hypothetical protein